MDTYLFTTYEAGLLIGILLNLALVAISFSGARSKAGGIPWWPLAWYAFFSGAHTAAHFMLIGGLSSYELMGHITLLACVFSLGLFGIQCFEKVNIRRINVSQMVAYSFAIVISLIIGRSVHGSLQLIAHLWAAHAIYVCIKEQSLGNSRLPRYLALAFMATGLGHYINQLTGFGGLKPYALHRYSEFGSYVVVIGCILMILGFAYTIRRVLIPKIVGERIHYTYRDKILLLLVLLIVVGAVPLVQKSGQLADAGYRKDIIETVTVAALASDAEIISDLTLSAAEVDNPRWRAQQLITQNVQKHLRSTRYAYLLRMDGDVMRYLADSDPVGTPGFFPPGMAYADVPQELVDAYAAKTAATVGPYTDKWGRWMTAAAPIILDSNGKIVAMFCIDVMASHWQSDVIQAELRTIWILLCIEGFLTFALAGMFIVKFKEQQLILANHTAHYRQIQLEGLVNRLPGLAFMKDAEHRYMIVNDNMCQLLARGREQILGKRDADLIVKQMGDEVEVDDRTVFQTGQASTRLFYGTLLPNDTRSRYFQSTKVPMFDEQNNVVGLIGLTLDMTEIHETRDRLARLNAELETALQSRRDNYRQLRVVMNAIPNPVFTRDCSGLYLSANRAYEEFVGMLEVDIIGRSVADIWGDDVAAALLKGEEDFRGHVESAELQARIRRHDNEMRDVVIHKGAFYSDAGLLIGVVGLITDITDIKHMEKELSVSEQRLQQIVNSLSDWVWECDTEMRYVYISDRVSFVTGYEPHELMGKSLVDFMLPDELDRMNPIVISMIATPNPIKQLVYSLRHKDGSERTMELTGVPMYDTVGAFIGYRGVSRDITERAEAQRHNAQLLSQLTALNEDLMDFVHITSHELKGPVRSIGSLAQMIYLDNEDSLKAESHDMLEQLQIRASRLYKVLDAYQQLAKVHTSFENTTSVDMEELVHEVLGTISLPDGTDMQISGQWVVLPIKRTQIMSALTNILINCITFMDKADGKIQIIGRDAGTEFTVKVIDNGPGIDPKYHKQVFQGFRRSQVSNQVDRTGIGLALVRRVVHGHGGRVGIESAHNQGTTIWFTLPKSGKAEGMWNQ